MAISQQEEFWRDQYNWFLSNGYQLRSRYHPDWKPSWVGKRKTGNRFGAEDAQFPPNAVVNHATRVKDGVQVVLKRVVNSKHPNEVGIMKYLSTEPLSSDPRNHSIPLLDALQPPDDEDITFIVIPLLREYGSPEFDTIGEALGFLDHFFEGISFLHEHGIAHGDLSEDNVMMDGQPLYPHGFYPLIHLQNVNAQFTSSVSAKYTRTEKPPRYYITDFGEAHQFDKPSGEADDADLSETAHTRKKKYAQDILAAGDTVNLMFIEGDKRFDMWQGRFGFEFLKPLIEAMTTSDWTERPTSSDLVSQFKELVKSLPESVLRGQCIPKPDPAVIQPLAVVTAFRRAAYWLRRTRYALTRTPPVPV